MSDLKYYIDIDVNRTLKHMQLNDLKPEQVNPEYISDDLIMVRNEDVHSSHYGEISYFSAIDVLNYLAANNYLIRGWDVPIDRSYNLLMIILEIMEEKGVIGGRVSRSEVDRHLCICRYSIHDTRYCAVWLDTTLFSIWVCTQSFVWED